jgi:hypothetical protein
MQQRRKAPMQMVMVEAEVVMVVDSQMNQMINVL